MCAGETRERAEMKVPVSRSEAGAASPQRARVSHPSPGQLCLLPGGPPPGGDPAWTGRVFIDWQCPASVLRH